MSCGTVEGRYKLDKRLSLFSDVDPVPTTPLYQLQGAYQLEYPGMPGTPVPIGIGTRRLGGKRLLPPPALSTGLESWFGLGAVVVAKPVAKPALPANQQQLANAKLALSQAVTNASAVHAHLSTGGITGANQSLANATLAAKNVVANAGNIKPGDPLYAQAQAAIASANSAVATASKAVSSYKSTPKAAASTPAPTAVQQAAANAAAAQILATAQSLATSQTGLNPWGQNAQVFNIYEQQILSALGPTAGNALIKQLATQVNAMATPAAEAGARAALTTPVNAAAAASELNNEYAYAYASGDYGFTPSSSLATAAGQSPVLTTASGTLDSLTSWFEGTTMLGSIAIPNMAIAAVGALALVWAMKGSKKGRR